MTDDEQASNATQNSSAKSAAKFITIEGIEGTGKSTVINVVAHWLTEQGMPFIQTREPGGTLVAEQIRELFLKKQMETMCFDTELLLVFAARAQHLNHVIYPALKEGKSVICDRFTDASYAYQGGGRGMSQERIACLEQWVQGTFRPDKVILLDAPVDICLQRTMMRGALDRIELEQEAFFERARAVYLDRAKHNPTQYKIVDAARTLPEVSGQIREILASIYGDKSC
ncbi:MAG: dTMP kinase [Gammaproteobacteria bacterium]|nr:dTMP kinase [Gammaproteobacteria bacterium]